MPAHSKKSRGIIAIETFEADHMNLFSPVPSPNTTSPASRHEIHPSSPHIAIDARLPASIIILPHPAG